jgi:hypothetical protein
MRVAFDLDETLGRPVIVENKITDFHLRPACLDLLQMLQTQHTLILWTVSTRHYLNQALARQLKPYFAETYSWDEIASTWKDIRKIRADYLVDDSVHHREAAKKYGLENRYLVIPAYGDENDQNDPLLWAKLIEEELRKNGS